MTAKELFKENKELLMSFALTKKDAYDDMVAWVRAKRKEGYTKQLLCDTFMELHKLIQVDSRCKDDEEVYDALSDFMDGFGSWGRNFILPDEPEVN